ncbi:uncharacterized protein LOC144738051 [Lampetra planeri]
MAAISALTGGGGEVNPNCKGEGLGPDQGAESPLDLSSNQGEAERGRRGNAGEGEGPPSTSELPSLGDVKPPKGAALLACTGAPAGEQPPAGHVTHKRRKGRLRHSPSTLYDVDYEVDAKSHKKPKMEY